MSRSLILYIAMSLDGFIATPDDDLSFLSMVEKEGEDYGYKAFTEGVDTVIIGRKTYEKVISMGVAAPHSDKKCYVLTRTERPAVGNTEFYSGDLKSLVLRLKNEEGKNIYMDGGAEAAHSLLSLGLIDEIIVSVIPILLGDGIRLFKEGSPKNTLQLISATSFEKGLVQLRYELLDI